MYYIKKSTPNLYFPVGFFDGATQDERCGFGAWIRIDYNQHYNIHWSGGLGTNMRAEALDLWGLMWFANFLNIPIRQVYGDSLAIINHVQG